MKRFLLLFMLAATIHVCYAQNSEKNLKEILLNKQWAGCNTNGEIDTGDYKIRCKFTADTLIVSFLGKDWDIKTPYYLSNTPDTSFNKEKVRKSDNGPYLIFKSSENYSYVYLRINVFSEDRFEYRYVYKDSKTQTEYIRNGTFICVKYGHNIF